MELKRVTFYFVNRDGVNDDEVEELFENCRFPNYCISPRQVTIEKIDIGEWGDDHRCNKCNYDLSQEFGCTYTCIDDDQNNWQCSECKCEWVFIEGDPKANNTKYCPECGRKIINVVPYKYEGEDNNE